MSRLSKWRLSITPESCIQCRLCENSCPFDAIRKPTPEKEAEGREPGIRRLAVLFLVLPILLLLGAWLGARLETPLSKHHATVQLAEQMAVEERGETANTTLQSEAFREVGGALSDLYDEAHAVKRRFRFGGALFGGFMGLVIGCRLIRLSLRRKHTDYEPDQGACLSCGRCFDYCPVGKSPEAAEKIRSQARNETNDRRKEG